MSSLDDHEYFESLLSMINNEKISLEFKVNYLKYATTVDNNPENWPDYTRNILSSVLSSFEVGRKTWNRYDPNTVISYAETLEGLGRMKEMLEVVRFLEDTPEVRMPSEQWMMVDSEPVRLTRRIMVLECLAGIEPTALDITEAGLSKIPSRSSAISEAYGYLATAVADCYNLYPGMDRSIDQIMQLINKSGDVYEKRGTAGIVFRKFCMPSETQCASSVDAIRIAEKNFLPIMTGDNLEKTFCFSQAAISLHGLSEKFPEMKEQLLRESELYLKKLTKLAGPKSKEINRMIRDMHLVRAYAHIGMNKQAEELGERFYGDAIESIDNFNGLMSRFQGFLVDQRQFPEKLKLLKEQTESMAEEYISVYVNGLLFSGRFAATRKFSDNMMGKLERILAMELPVMIKLKGLLDASEAYAYRNDPERSMRLLKMAVTYSGRIPARERQGIIVNLFTRTASENYLYTGDPVFISTFMDIMKKEGIGGTLAEEAARFFADNLSSVAFSRKLGIAFG